jgi:hypothetical protein
MNHLPAPTSKLDFARCEEPVLVERDRCVVCRQRITTAGWEPFCCEVCFDSADAAERRLLESGALKFEEDPS